MHCKFKPTMELTCLTCGNVWTITRLTVFGEFCRLCGADKDLHIRYIYNSSADYGETTNSKQKTLRER